MGRSFLLLFIVASHQTVLVYTRGCDQNAIYIDSKNGTSESVCWTGGEKQPCSSLDLALEGARQLNSTVVIPAGLLEEDNFTDHPQLSNYDSCRLCYTSNSTSVVHYWSPGLRAH